MRQITCSAAFEFPFGDWPENLPLFGQTIPCACGTYFVGQTGWSGMVRQKEHQSHLKPGHMDKSALADHGTGHSILLDQMEVY